MIDDRRSSGPALALCNVDAVSIMRMANELTLLKNPELRHMAREKYNNNLTD